jgi:hypothetical protein
VNRTGRAVRSYARHEASLTLLVEDGQDCHTVRSDGQRKAGRSIFIIETEPVGIVWLYTQYCSYSAILVLQNKAMSLDCLGRQIRAAEKQKRRSDPDQKEDDPDALVFRVTRTPLREPLNVDSV